MFCSKCGNRIDDLAVICPFCGCPSRNYIPQNQGGQIDKVKVLEEARKMALVSIIGGIFIPLLGWIFGALGIMKCNSINTYLPNDNQISETKKKCIIGLIVSTVIFVISFIVVLILIFNADDILYDLYY